MRYYSQFRQDKFIDFVVFNKKKSGFFIDIGAYDGILFSNSYFFEITRNWRGICFEPNPTVFEKLRKNRKSLNYNACIGSEKKDVLFWQIKGSAEMLSGIREFYDQQHLERIGKESGINNENVKEILVEMAPITNFIKFDTAPIPIDFLSIDTEGNEIDILKSIDFKLFSIKSISIENNYHKYEIDEILEKNNFEKLIILGCDYLYVHKDLLKIGLKLRLFCWKVFFTSFDFFIKKKKNFLAKVSFFLKK